MEKITFHRMQDGTELLVFVILLCGIFLSPYYIYALFPRPSIPETKAKENRSYPQIKLLLPSPPQLKPDSPQHLPITPAEILAPLPNKPRAKVNLKKEEKNNSLQFKEISIQQRLVDEIQSAKRWNPSSQKDKETYRSNGNGIVFDADLRQDILDYSNRNQILPTKTITVFNSFGEKRDLHNALHVRANNGCTFRKQELSNMEDQWFIVGCEDPEKIHFSY